MPVVGRDARAAGAAGRDACEALAPVRGVSRMTTGFLDVPDGGRLAFEDVGRRAGRRAHPSGALGHRGRGTPQVPVLVAAGYRVLRYDVRGYGRSSRPEPGVAYSHVRDLWALLDARRVDTGAIVGCSMGGAIDLDFALDPSGPRLGLGAGHTGLGGFESSQEEDDWFEDLVAPIEEAIADGRPRAGAGPSTGAPVGTARDRGRRRQADPRDRVRQLARADDGRERRRGARSSRGASAARGGRPDAGREGRCGPSRHAADLRRDRRGRRRRPQSCRSRPPTTS